MSKGYDAETSDYLRRLRELEPDGLVIGKRTWNDKEGLTQAQYVRMTPRKAGMPVPYFEGGIPASRCEGHECGQR